MDWVQAYFQMKMISEVAGGIFILMIVLLLVAGTVLDFAETQITKFRKGKKK
jgi:hypothetical protein